LGHHDDGRYAAVIGGKRYALRVVPGGCTDCAALRDCVGQMSDAVIRTAQLEREDGLQIFALQQHLVVEPARQAGGFFQRGLDRNVVHPRFEDSFDVRTGHGRVSVGEGVGSLTIFAALRWHG
jgi:hypothetical protein